MIMIVIILPSQHDAPGETASERHNLGFYELQVIAEKSLKLSQGDGIGKIDK